MRIGLAGARAGGAGGVLNNLSDGLISNGHEVIELRSILEGIRKAPLRKPLITAAAAFDNVVLKHPEWPSLVTYSRDYLSQVSYQSLSDLDLLIVRWNSGVMPVSQTPAHVPIIWGLPDENTFTGICHYSGECRNFTTGCHLCPAQRVDVIPISSKHLERKIQGYKRTSKITFVAPSDWMLRKAQSSLISTFPIIKIPNPLHSDFFTRPSQARKSSVIPRIGFASSNVMDPLKGFDLVDEILSDYQLSGHAEIHVAGHVAKKDLGRLSAFHYHGHIDARAEFIDFLDALDFILVPSKEEAAGMVAVEAMARGVIPIVANAGGLPEQVGPLKDLVAFDEPQEIVALIRILFSSLPKFAEIARNVAARHEPSRIAQRYANVYNEI